MGNAIVEIHPDTAHPLGIKNGDWVWIETLRGNVVNKEVLAATDAWPYNAGEKVGLLTTAQLGKGTWTYVGLGLWRQLPAGTPGAYRILANLIAKPRIR